MDLEFGGYDYGGTPSATLLRGKVPFSYGESGGEGGERGNRAWYLPGRSIAECRDPAVSPLWAELHDLPPALLTVGTADWLLDDNLFLAARLDAAGNDVELAVWPECPHGIPGMPTTLGRLAAERIDHYVRARLASESARAPAATG
jgi:acetyl esterase/lipase